MTTRPKTGEKRKTRLPLKIDRLPQGAKDAIETLYNRGRTWVEIAEQSAKPYSKEWEKDGGGFIDWVEVDTDALELFPGLRLAKSSLQRWFDLRIAQVRSQVMAESAKTRVWVEALASKDVAGTNAAVTNLFSALFPATTNLYAAPAVYVQQINPTIGGLVGTNQVLFVTTTNCAVYFGGATNVNYSLTVIGH